MVNVAGVEAVPKPIAVGPEMDALRRFIPKAVTWEGTIHENGMGPGTPEMTGVGHGSAKLIQDGRWIAGDYQQDQFLEPIIPLIGEDNIIWGADYPHPDCIWPDSRRHIEENLGKMPDRIRQKITRDNVVKLYNLS